MNLILDKALNQIENLSSEINEITKVLLPDTLFFEDVTLKEVKGPSEDSVFLHLVSHIYGLFFERSRINTPYIINQLDLVTENPAFADEFLKIIHNLRTYYSHINKNNDRDHKIKMNCFMWFYEHGIITPPPSQLEEWDKLNKILFDKAIELLNQMKKCVEFLVEDEYYDADEWLVKKKKDIPDHKLIKLVDEVFETFSLVDLDSYQFVKKNGSKIKKKLETIDFSDFGELNRIVKKIIEQELFTSQDIPCPVSGEDLKLYFDVEGKELGILKRKAIELHQEDIYRSKDDIINLLQLSLK